MYKKFVRNFCLLLIVVATFVCTLTACGAVEFKVKFVVDDEIYATIDTSGGDVIRMPADPQKEDYVFDGWFWDKDTWQRPFTANSLLDAPLSSDMSVYAKWTTEEAVKGTEAVFEGFEKVGDYEYSIAVSNSTATLSLEAFVTINSHSRWSLSTDIYGNQTIASKTVTPKVGDNIFYALVTADNGRTQQYTLHIKRNGMYTVTFDTAGGTPVEKQIVEENGFASAPTTTKVGYVFVSWDYDFDDPITENTTVVASWAAKKYPVILDANGGIGGSESVEAVYDGAMPAATAPNDIDGYAFMGYSDEEGVQYYDADMQSVKNWDKDFGMTLYAQWKEIRFTITFNYNYAGAPTAATIDKNIGGSVSVSELPEEPIRNGLRFVCWTLVADNRGTEVTFPFTVESDTTLYAYWVEVNIYTVRFDKNIDIEDELYIAYIDDAIASPAEQKLLEGEYVRFSAEYSRTGFRSGFSFLGWSENKDATNASQCVNQRTYTATKNVTLYAIWKQGSYNVNFKGNMFDGTDNVTNFVVQSGVPGRTEIDAPNTEPTRTGYKFMGWYTAARGGEEITFPTKIYAKSNFYAHWQANAVETKIFDAEFASIDPDAYFYGYSGTAKGVDIISSDRSNMGATIQPEAGMDNTGLYVSYLYKNGTTLTFNINSDRACSATLTVRLSIEILSAMTFAPTGECAYKIKVNGEEMNYNPIVFNDESNTSDSPYGSRDFEDYTLGTIQLKEGENVIELITANDFKMGGSMQAAAPTVDCIKLECDAILTWHPEYDNVKKI